MTLAQLVILAETDLKMQRKAAEKPRQKGGVMDLLQLQRAAAQIQERERG